SAFRDAVEKDDSFHNFTEFNSSLPDYVVPYRTEFVVSNVVKLIQEIESLSSKGEDVSNHLLKLESMYKICGSIDMVYRDTRDGSFILCDWKRCKPISKDSYGKMLKSSSIECVKFDPNGLTDCSFNKYSLQLNIYKRLFESVHGNSGDGRI